MKNKINNLLQSLNAEIYALNETRDILSMRVLKDYKHPYEAVVGFPASMGERGKNFSMYYDSIPNAEEIYLDFKKELKSYVKSNDGLNGYYDEEAIKIAKKILRIK